MISEKQTVKSATESPTAKKTFCDRQATTRNKNAI